MPALTPEHQDTLRRIHEGRDPLDDAHVAHLVEGRYMEMRDGRYHLTDTGLGELRLARGFGEAIADAVIPGAGSRHAMKD